MASFSEALNRPAETIKRPPPPPLGHYIMGVAKVPGAAEPINTQKFQGSKLTIPIQIISASDDVDMDELEAFGNPAGFNLRLDFLFNEAPGEEMKFESTLNRLKEFCAAAGADVETGTPQEWLMNLPGAQFLGELRHRVNPNDVSEIYPEIGRITAI